jgi:hypothetical protein
MTREELVECRGMLNWDGVAHVVEFCLRRVDQRKIKLHKLPIIVNC